MAMVIYDWATSNSNLEEDLKLMRDKAETLFARAADISTEVRNAELHPGKKRKRQVDNWMQNARELKIRMDRIEEEVEQGQIGLFNSKRLRDQILKITEEMEELLKHAAFQNGLTIHDLASSNMPLLTTNMKGQQFENNSRMILSWLQNDEAYKLGVYGIGGVGKTTLATHIHNQLLHVQGKSATVCWVTVSQKCTILELQRRIAKELSLPVRVLEDADKMRRPAILSEALKKKGDDVDHVVVILDDVWNPFPVEEVGLLTGENGCKLLLTSRSLDVCRRMECMKLVKVETLSEEESWSLFTEKLGNYDDLPLEAKGIAKLVARECDGLPLGIVVVSASMRGIFDVYEWNNTLEELKNPTRIHEGMENEVFPSLQLSYSRLNTVMLQNCFLSCALYPEDWVFRRDKLVNFWIMEGHLDEIQSRQKQLDMAYTMLNKLLNACLLDVSDPTKSHVKMHDLIRDMAIRISSQRDHTMIKAGMELQEVPRVQEWTGELTKVSLVQNNIREIPSGMTPMCPNLSCLLLEGNPLVTIPDSFLSCFNGLKFLDLTNTSIERVPNRISYLENLSALKLASCYNLTYVPSLAKLVKLRHLDLSHCGSFKVLPQGTEKLANLECLLLSGNHDLCVPFSELTSGLSNIQCLELGCGVKDTLISDIQKLGSLQRLMRCVIHNTNDFNRYVKSHLFQQLISYQLMLGSAACIHSIDCFYDRIIIIEHIKIEGGAGAEPAQLPDNIQELQVASCDFQVRSLADALPSLYGLKRLVRIFMYQCEGIESIWSESSCANPPLENLEELILSDLHSFRTLSKGRVQLPPGAFSGLKKLKVEYCSTIKKLFTPCLLRCQLRNLEEIEIQVCYSLEEIFADAECESGDATLEVNQVNTLNVELPKLRILSLIFLQNLESICKTGLLCCKSIEQITVINCRKLKKLPVGFQVFGNGVPSAPPSLLKILVERDWWESLLWGDHRIKHILQPFVVFRKLE